MSLDEIESLKAEVRKRMTMKKYGNYYINGYAMLFAIETGVRVYFCHEDGEWIKTDAYITFLRRLCQSKNFNVTNNHALRMSLNSNVLLLLGISAADRAAMLGHSIETNLKYYSFAQKDYLDNVRALLDSVTGDEPAEAQNTARPRDKGTAPVQTQGTLVTPSNVIIFPKKESLEHLNYQAF